MSKEKINNHQLYSLTAYVTCGSSPPVIASPVAESCGRSGQITPIVSNLFEAVFILFYYALGRLFSNKNLTQITCAIFGKWLGAIISICFIILCIHSGIQIAAYIGQFITTEYFITSPAYSISPLIFITITGALLYDLEATVHSPKTLLKVVIFTAAFLSLVGISNIKTRYTQPVFENGFCSIFKGSLYITSYRTWPLIFLNMIYPIHTDNSFSTLKAVLKGYFLGSLITLLVMLMSVLVLGTHVTSAFAYFIYFLAKQISFGFLSRIEGLIVDAWFITLPSKGFCYFYVGIRSISTLMYLKGYRKTVCPILFAVLICSNIVYPSSACPTFQDKYAWISYSFTVGFLLPAFIVIAYFIQKALQKTSRPKLAQDST